MRRRFNVIFIVHIYRNLFGFESVCVHNKNDWQHISGSRCEKNMFKNNWSVQYKWKLCDRDMTSATLNLVAPNNMVQNGQPQMYVIAHFCKQTRFNWNAITCTNETKIYIYIYIYDSKNKIKRIWSPTLAREQARVLSANKRVNCSIRTALQVCRRTHTERARLTIRTSFEINVLFYLC